MTIWNHYSPKLSNIDTLIIESVPPGGNWKNIPTSIPSQRLAQIRESYKKGGGSRSTYYGRLRPDAPAYTISTYISRPGNGCHIHYEQNRLISQREAARLQSFPDSFVFYGSKAKINEQIGNAVPPLLAFQIARQLGSPGATVDLFSGAGGLGLGFKWAGWTPVIANDIQDTYLETYKSNVHSNTIHGDIRDAHVFGQLVDAGVAARKASTGKKRLLVLGGPPCQGYSTAGNRRTMDDHRNHLFTDYVRYIEKVEPDGFVFENVMGLTNMDGGAVFQAVTQALSRVASKLVIWKMAAEDYAIPQRRRRLIIIGLREPVAEVLIPETICGRSAHSLVAGRGPITTKDALDDLPVIGPGEDGSSFDYDSPAHTEYQQLMRSLITPEQYLEGLKYGASNSEACVYLQERLLG